MGVMTDVLRGFFISVMDLLKPIPLQSTHRAVPVLHGSPWPLGIKFRDRTPHCLQASTFSNENLKSIRSHSSSLLHSISSYVTQAFHTETLLKNLTSTVPWISSLFKDTLPQLGNMIFLFLCWIMFWEYYEYQTVRWLTITAKVGLLKLDSV